MNKKGNSIVPGFILFSIFVFCMSGCKFSGDALAEYNGGKITRGQMYEWLEVRGISKDATIKKKSIQKSKLRQMALDNLAEQEALKSGFDKSDVFQKKLNGARRSFCAGYMQKDLSKNAKFSEEAVSVRLIKLTVQSSKIENKKSIALTGKELEEAFKLKNDAALKVIKEYESGAKFEDLAKKYSDDITGKNGGFAGYITRDMREPEFTDAVFKMNKGEYSKTPLKAGNAFYIAMVEDKTAITDENIESIIKDKNNTSTMKKRLIARGIKSRVDQLKQEKDVETKFDVIDKGSPSAVIFRAGNISCTVKDLNDYIDKIYNKALHPDQKPLDSKTKKDLAERLLTEELLARELIRTGMDKKDPFTKEWSYYYRHLLSSEYKNSQILAEIDVTDQEIKEEYEKNKNRSYAKREMKGKKMVQSFYPLNEIKGKIKMVLTNKKKIQALRVWEEKLLTSNNFKINENKLEGK